MPLQALRPRSLDGGGLRLYYAQPHGPLPGVAGGPLPGAYRRTYAAALHLRPPRVVEEATRLVATHLFKSPRYEIVFRRVSPGVLLDLPGLRVEAASAEAVLQHGCAILEKRRHLIVASVGALTKLPRCGAGLVFAISGAIGGLDFVAETAARCTTSCINTAPRKKTGGGTALLADAAPAELRRRHQAGGGEAGGRRGEGRRAGGPHRP